MHATQRGWMLAGLLATGLAMFLFSGSHGGDGGRSPSEAGAEVNKLIVHEWGTFTNFSGSNGLQLEFRPLLDSDLPSFVYDRAMHSASPFLKSSYRARQRMETPVTYFYTDKPREVDVRVDFPKGLLTEFYPPVKQMGPAFNYAQPAKLQDSFLDWGRIRLLPQADFDAIEHKNDDGSVWKPSIPKVEGDNHYAYARETDSAVVEFPHQWFGKFYEKFLFYRGLGSFSLPLELKALGKGAFRITNSGNQAVDSLFLVHVDQGRIHFSFNPKLEAGRTLTMHQSKTASTREGLGEAVVAALLETGLYEKEARSMVKTWQSSWFGEEGTRLFYVLPQPLTDELLPLTVSPAPDEVVRVLVGRMEVLTPERSEQLTRTLAGMGTCASAELEPLQSELARLGRFAEPALASMQQSEADPHRRSQLTSLLDEIRQDHGKPALK